MALHLYLPLCFWFSIAPRARVRRNQTCDRLLTFRTRASLQPTRLSHPFPLACCLSPAALLRLSVFARLPPSVPLETADSLPPSYNSQVSTRSCWTGQSLTVLDSKQAERSSDTRLHFATAGAASQLFCVAPGIPTWASSRTTFTQHRNASYSANGCALLYLISTSYLFFEFVFLLGSGLDVALV